MKEKEERMKIKQIIKETTRGAFEGGGKKLAEAGIEIITEKGKESIKTHIFGIGPADEAKYILALGTLHPDKQKIITDFAGKLSKSEVDWFRRTIAEMDIGNGGVILKQLADLDDHKIMREKGEKAGLIKKSSIETADEALSKGMKTLSDNLITWATRS